MFEFWSKRELEAIREDSREEKGGVIEIDLFSKSLEIQIDDTTNILVSNKENACYFYFFTFHPTQLCSPITTNALNG